MDEIMKHTHGVPTLLKMNENPQYKDIIVVFQTGMTEIEDKKKFLEAGSLYLLQKPFSYKVQKVIIDSILPIVRAKRRIKEKINTGRIYNKEEFILSTLDEAEDVAASLSINFPEPYKVYEAIYELVKNGIEHGNLGIGYNTKTHILEEGSYVDEITSRAVSSENKNKMIKTYLTKDDSYLTLYIEDQGQGFNFDDFPKFDIEGLKKPCGRGIYKASQVFDNIKYLNNGSMVVCQHKLH
jgi:response regulator RpfG family c-di-GMP phosphodiesterase